ncbi:hypothetical protein [Caulobacter sp. UNC358MFTsu5.1]|uniref:hypothetical protein n=1 Tax=Caulobacter sp. UNC358MFTsu5.1 TaxID=1449049 RepID=UPI0004A72FD5|nr:hypothetical protein [Caulobacter sp. UNC358MFTsu5.1]
MTLILTRMAALRIQNARADLVAAVMRVRARLGLLPPPQVRHAAAHWRKGVTYVHAMGASVAGVHHHMPPVQRFEADADAAEIGAAVLAGLAAYRERLRFPPADSPAAKARYLDFLKLLDARTNAEMAKGGKFVTIEGAADTLRFTPWRNEGARRGFSGMPPETNLELPADASLEDLGKALAEAFARCA